MKRKRLLWAVVAGALVAVAAAVPVVAGGVLRGIPAESGYIRMAPHTWSSQEADSTPLGGVQVQSEVPYSGPTTYTVDGPSTVRLAFDTKAMLDAATPGPTSWVLVATKLPYLGGLELASGGRALAPDGVTQEWALVQIDRLHYTEELSAYWHWDVTLLKKSVARKGFLTMKGTNVLTPPDWKTWHRFSGWELWLVPSRDLVAYELVQNTGPSESGYFLPTDVRYSVQCDWFLPLLGGPAQEVDYQHPYGSNGD